MVNKFALLLIIFFCGWLQPFRLVASAPVLTMDAAINVAGRQRMLTQRIAKSYLLIGQGVATRKFTQQLQSGLQLFEQQLAQLNHYFKQQNNEKVLLSVQQKWLKFNQAVQQKPGIDQVFKVIKAADSLLVRCEQLVITLEQQAKSKKTRMINLAGRQRMLSQRIAMLYVGLSWGVVENELQENLQTAINEYDKALGILRVSPVNNVDLNIALDRVISQWQFSRSGFEFMENDQYVPFVIAATTESMLKKMEGITSQYEAIY